MTISKQDGHRFSSTTASVAGALLSVAFAVGIAVMFQPADKAMAQDAGGEGAAIFSESCASCHQPNGAGIPGSFPPLRGNPNVADVTHVETVISEGLSGPLEVDGVTYDAVMPAVALSDAERTAVATYVASLADAGAPPDVTTAPPEPGNAVEGQSLFIGATRLEAGAAACASCHIAGEVGSFGGPTLGPDLTDVTTRLGGEAGLAAWLTKPPSKTMTPIFSKHPLTPAETADLAAFLAFAPEQQKPTSRVDQLLVGALVGTVLLVAGMAVAYRGMRQTYVEKLRSRA